MVGLAKMMEAPKGTRVFKANLARYGFMFFGFSLSFMFGVWLTFIASDETIASASRRRPFGDATGPITMLLFGFLSWAFRPSVYNRGQRDLVFSPSGLRYAGFVVRWSQVTQIKKMSGPYNTRFISFGIVDPQAFKANQFNWFQCLMGATGEAVTVPTKLIDAPSREVLAVAEHYWQHYHDSPFQGEDTYTPLLSDHRRTAEGYGWNVLWGFTILLGLAGLTAVIAHKGSVSQVSGATVTSRYKPSILEISGAMHKDAGRMATSIQKILAGPDSQQQLMAPPIIDALSRVIELQIIERSQPKVFYEDALNELILYSKTNLCHLYQQTALGTHSVTARQTLYNRNGAPIYSFDIDPKVCKALADG